MTETQVIDDRRPDAADVAPRRQQVAREMAAGDRVNDEAEAVDQEYPREKEMPRAGHREPLVARYGQPRRKALRVHPRIVGRKSEHTGRDELVPEEARVADRLALRILARADLEPGGPSAVRRIADVQRGMRVEYLQAAHQHQRQRHRVDPVHDAHGERMAVVQRTRRRSRCARRSIDARYGRIRLIVHGTKDPSMRGALPLGASPGPGAGGREVSVAARRESLRPSGFDAGARRRFTNRAAARATRMPTGRS